MHFDYADVYSGFLGHVEITAARCGLKTLVERCRRRMIGGQENLIADAALDMLKR